MSHRSIESEGDKPKAITFIVENYSAFQALGTTEKSAITINLTEAQLKELSSKMGKECSVLECYVNYDLSKNKRSNVK